MRYDPQEPAGPDMGPDREPLKAPFYAPDESWVAWELARGICVLGDLRRSLVQDSPCLLEGPRGQQQLNYEYSLW
eukprot:3629495-Pyramimonas_sp.AAC.1